MPGRRDARRGRRQNVGMSAIVPRRLPANPSNFRDLADVARSARLRPHVLYRSDHLAALQPQDCEALAALGVRRVLDFRGVHERATHVCALPDVAVHSLAIEPTVVQMLQGLLASGQPVTGAQAQACMLDTYRGFVRTSTHRFAEFFALLLASDEPTVFHCTAGKDRTGFAAALVLRVLGASHDEIVRDYLLTNERFKPPATLRAGLPAEVAAVLFGVEAEYLDAAFEAVDDMCGNFDAYVRDGLRLGEPELQRLRSLYQTAEGARR